MSRCQRTSVVILGLLGMSGAEPRSGYEIKKVIDTIISHFWSESHGQLYPALKQLEADGLIRSVSRTAKGRRKTRYAITAQGRERLREWLALPPEQSTPRDELILKLFFGSETDPQTLIAHLQAHRAQAAALLDQCRAWQEQASSHGHPYGRFHLITIRSGIAHAEASIAWADATIAELSSLAAKSKHPRR